MYMYATYQAPPPPPTHTPWYAPKAPSYWRPVNPRVYRECIQLHVFALVSNESISRCTYIHVCTHVHVLSVASSHLSFTGGGHAYWDGYGGLLQLLAGDITIPLFHCLCVQCSLHCTSDIISHCECPYCSALSVRVQVTCTSQGC